VYIFFSTLHQQQEIHTKWPNMSVIMDKIEEYLSLPKDPIERINQNPNFGADSEESKCTLILMWMNHDTSPRSIWAEELLRNIDFSRFHRWYLISIIGPMVRELRDPVKTFISDKYLRAIEKKNNIPTATEPRQLAFRVVFHQISTWEVGEKYYSKGVLSFGYVFYFFLRPNRNQNDAASTLDGYLRCICPATPIPSHCLPVSILFEIELQGGNKRTLPPIQKTFDFFDRAIGTHINLPGEDWERIKRGDSEIILNDAITIFITVDYLEEIPDQKN